jgi:uncharacterized protein
MVAGRNPLIVGVKDLVHQAGEMREVTLDVPTPEKYGEAMATVPGGTPMRVQLRLEGLHEGVLATGEVHLVAAAECVRCLDPVSFDLGVDFQELFAYSSSDSDSYTVVDDSLNLEDIIRDAVVLELPFQPVCGEDCYGLDPATGEKRTEPPGNAVAEEIDPRWQELSKLLESDPEKP